MVGNISDIHPDTATRQYMPNRSWKNITPNVKMPAAIASIFNKLPGLKYFSKNVQIKRLTQKDPWQKYCKAAT